MKLQSRASKIIEKLKKEGRVSYANVKYNPEQVEKMRRIIRDHKRKQAASILAARNTIIC